MNITLNNVGITDTVENNRMIADNLLEAARQVEPGNTKIISYIEGTNGTVQVESWWNITSDGKPYLTTMILKPVE